MKKTRIAGLLLSIATAGVLASCGNPAQELAACEAALTKSIATVTGTPLSSAVKTELSGDSNDIVTVTTKQVVNVEGNKYTVDLSWSWDEEFNDLITQKAANDDDTHAKLYFNYPSKAEQENGLDTKFKVEAKVNKQVATAEYSVHLAPCTYKFNEMTIAELYALKDSGDTFAFMNEDGDRISTNYGQDFYYVKVSGKLVYVAPDKNFGILADGNHYVYLFKINKYGDPGAAVVGKYFRISASISQYYGHIQLSYIKNIEELDDHSNIAEPTKLTITNDINEKGSAGFKPFYADDTISRMIEPISGVATNPMIGVKSGNTTVMVASTFGAFTGAVRFTFDLKLDDTHTITVAYDYHTGKSDTKSGTATREAFTKVLTAVTDGSTKLTVKGYLTFNNPSNSIGPDGAWQIVPLEAGDIVNA